jgi:transcription antitermination factor NusG
MAILAAEKNIYPDNLLLDQIGAANDVSTECRWWAIYTKSRQEKSLARDLCSFQIPFYLPLVPKDNLIRGKRVRSMLPLFSGYVFVYGSDDQRVQTLTTNRVSRIIPVEDGLRLCHDLQRVDRLLKSNKAVLLEKRIDTGRKVRVKNGPFEGLEGVVICRRGVDRLLVSVHYLQQGISMELNDFNVEVL